MTPASVFLTYKKYLSAPSVFVEFEPIDPSKSVEISSGPDWITGINSGALEQDVNGDNTKYRFRIKVNAAVADNLSPGIHTGTVQWKGVDSNGNPIRVGEFLEVSVEIIDNQILTLSKKDFSFDYVIGGSAPATQPLGITTENAWSIIADEPWINFSVNSGNGTQNINVGVDPTGLSVGLYEGTFQVDDGETIKQGTVKLLISGEDSSGDYLDVSVTSLSFSEIYQEAPSRVSSVNISSSLAVTISTSAPWLNLSDTSLAAGDSQLLVNTQNTEELSIGSYTGTIKIESGYSVRTINVLLRIVEVNASGISSGKLYFAKDRNTLVLTTSVPNAEAFLEFFTTPKNYERRVPFFNDIAEIIIGLETSTLLKPNNLPSVLQSGGFVPVKPLSMDFDVYDKVINSTALSARLSFAQVKFINGKTPSTPNRLTNIPSKVTMPKDGLLCFSFFSEEFVDRIYVTGDYVGEINFGDLETQIYTAMVDLSLLNLKPGDSIQVSAGPVTVQVKIKPTTYSSTRLIWLNEWDCPEVFNLEGVVKIDTEAETSTVEISEAGKILQRIIEIREPASFRIGTGNIYSDAEVKWLSRVLSSKKLWLEIDGERIEVIPDFRRLTTSETREHIRNFTLSFNSAEK